MNFDVSEVAFNGLRKRGRYYVLLVPYFPSPRYWNGAFFYNHARALRRAGLDVIVINLQYAGDDYEYGGLKIWPLAFDTRMAMLLGRWQDRSNYHKFVQCLNRHGVAIDEIAVIESGNIENAGGVLCEVKRKNPKALTVTFMQDPDPYGCNKISARGNLGGWKRVLTYWRNRRLVESMDVIATCSQNVARVVEEFPRQSVYNTFAPTVESMKELRKCRSGRVKRIIVLHNGVDTRVFNPEGHRKGGDVFEIGLIGHLWSHWFKDPMTLVRAMDLLKDKLGEWKLSFIGSGDCIQMVKDYARERGFEDRLCFYTEVDHRQLPDFYRQWDLFVLPSYWEAFGCVFTEAWSCGTPFITCKGQGMDDQIFQEDRQLWLCNERDPVDLAEKILYFYRHRPAQRMASPVDIDEITHDFLNEISKIPV